MELPYVVVDVFGDKPFSGNPVAVVYEADNLTTEQMQLIAQWTNLSETTFLLRPTDSADYRVRIFTPRTELPFAGHPTLGTAHAWLERSGSKQKTLWQECGAGLVELNNDGLLSFAAPPLIRSGEVESSTIERIAQAFGIESKKVINAQWVDNGPGWIAIEVSTAQEVIDLKPDFSKAPELMVGVIGAYPVESDAAYEVRVFGPREGVIEDPVTGSFNAGVAQWLFAIGAQRERYQVWQGRCVGRSGTVTLTAQSDGRSWVGGSTRTLAAGNLSLA